MVKISQNTPEWLEMRRSHIGASDAPIIMNESPFKTPYQLWEEKLGLAKQPEMNFAMRRGHDLEPIALQAYNDYTGNCASPEVVFSKEHDWMMSSLDGLSLDRNIIVEIKCPGAPDHNLAKEGKIPEKYWAQLQHQLATIDLSELHYFSYKDGEFALVEVERDPDYVAKLLKKEIEFWKKLRNMEPPALSAKDYVGRQDDSWISAAQEWALVHEQIEELKAKEKEHRKTLISLAGTSNCQGAGIRVQKVIRKGTVDYKAIPELSDVDLEKYRKTPVESWRLGCVRAF